MVEEGREAAKEAKGSWASELKKRGVVIVAVPAMRAKGSSVELDLSEDEAEEAKGFGSSEAPDAPAAAPSMAETVAKAGAKGLELEAAALDEWREFFDGLLEEKGAASRREGAYLQINFDGAIRVSGIGMPSWEAMAQGLSPKDDFSNKLVEQ